VRILSAILAIAFAAFILKPYTGMMPVADKTECCAKSGCEKHPKAPEKKDCSNTGCNMLTCAFCSYFMAPSAGIHWTIPPANRERHIAVNDHRLYFISSDCWHPPKQLSVYSV